MMRGPLDATRHLSRGFERVLLRVRLARARTRRVFLREEALPPARVVEAFDPAFAEGEAAYNGLGVRDDKTYAAISTKQLHAGARLFALEGDALRGVADLDAVLTRERAIPHGKVHVDLALAGDRLIGATHIGYYDPHARDERPGTAPGFLPYPGGWFFAIERDERITPLAQAPAGEGIITMSADPERGLLHALTWPNGLLLTHELGSGATANRGRVFGDGETGAVKNRICRSIGIDPESGAAFWSDGSGAIFRLDGARIERVASMPRNEMWRKVVWHPQHRLFYGVAWSSGTLFRFDPHALRCEELATLNVSDAAATLAFALDPDLRRLHYLSTGPGVLRRGDIQLATTVWSRTHDLESHTTTTHGPLRLAGGRWVTQAQALAVVDGKLVSICHVEVPRGDRSPRVERIRELRRHTPEFRARGYAEEMMVTRFDA